jgi:hypothetical protein
MQKTNLILVLFGSFLLGCSEAKNILLPAELIVSSFVPIDSSFYFSDSLSLYRDNIAKYINYPIAGSNKTGIRLQDFMIQKVSENHLKLYDPYLFYNFYENLNSPLYRIKNLSIPHAEINAGLLKNDEWKRNLGGGLDSTMVDGKIRVWENPIRKDQIKSLFFIEKWKLTINPLNFRKEIIAWSPVRYYQKYYENDSTGIPVKRFVFSVLQKPDLEFNSKMVYAGKFQYEFFLGVDDPASFNFGNPYERTIESFAWSRFSKTSLVNSIIELAVTGRIPAYDPKNLNLLAVSKIRESLGEGRDSVLVNDKWQSFLKEIKTDNILSVIFIENWYIKPDDLQIYKEGLGIAPVQYSQDDIDPNKYSKSVPFIILYKKP